MHVLESNNSTRCIMFVAMYTILDGPRITSTLGLILHSNSILVKYHITSNSGVLILHPNFILMDSKT